MTQPETHPHPAMDNDQSSKFPPPLPPPSDYPQIKKCRLILKIVKTNYHICCTEDDNSVKVVFTETRLRILLLNN